MHLSGGPLALLGEVRTGLLPESTALTSGSAEDLLTLVHGRRVQSRERPVEWTRSPVVAEGIDCRLVTPTRSRVRVVGTVVTQAVVFGGRILQSSAQTTVIAGAGSTRRSWRHYLDRIGVIETLTRTNDDIGSQLVEGFLWAADPEAANLDLGAIAARVHTRVRCNPMLNQRPPLRTGATRLRWAALLRPGETPSMSFILCDDETRLASVVVGDESELGAVQRFCEDLAVHDWLLSVLTDVISESDLAEATGTSPVQAFAPLLEHLAHLWLPGAVTPEALHGLWVRLEAEAACSRQWHAGVGRLRDRLAVATWALRRSEATAG